MRKYQYGFAYHQKVKAERKIGLLALIRQVRSVRLRSLAA